MQSSSPVWPKWTPITCLWRLSDREGCRVVSGLFPATFQSDWAIVHSHYLSVTIVWQVRGAGLCLAFSLLHARQTGPKSTPTTCLWRLSDREGCRSVSGFFPAAFQSGCTKDHSHYLSVTIVWQEGVQVFVWLLPCIIPVWLDQSTFTLPVCDDCLTGRGAGLWQASSLLHSSLARPKCIPTTCLWRLSDREGCRYVAGFFPFDTVTSVLCPAARNKES